jgi:hypothetical protein
MNKEQILKAFSEFCNTHFGDVATEEVHQDVEVRKSVDEMERRALFVVLEPQNDDGTTEDLHGDWYDDQDVVEACRSFNVHCQKANLYHNTMVDESVAVIEQSYTSPSTFDITLQDGSSRTIKKNTWLQEWHFPVKAGDNTWDEVLSGHFTGLSVKCGAMGYLLEDDK